MFGNNNKKNNATEANKAEEELAEKINQDMRVRNMPSPARLSGPTAVLKQSARPESSQTSSGNLAVISGASAAPKNNTKMVGMVIIAGGVVFIGVLVYLSYIYIIKPQVKNVPSVVLNTNQAAPINNNSQPLATTSEITVATTSLVATVTPTTLDLATSTASSSPDLEMVAPQNNLPPLVDSDNDGINDEEEVALGTNPNSADSNGNTYSDLTEINNNYDPAGSGKLATNASLGKYENKTLGYEITYPKSWEIKSLNNDATITFTTPDSSLIQISVQDNSDKQTILDWYNNSFPNVTPTYDRMKSTASWDGIYGDDGLNFYATDKKHTNIYVISYIPFVDGRLAYPNIFKLMINSFLVK